MRDYPNSLYRALCQCASAMKIPGRRAAPHDPVGRQTHWRVECQSVRNPERLCRGELAIGEKVYSDQFRAMTEKSLPFTTNHYLFKDSHGTAWEARVTPLTLRNPRSRHLRHGSRLSHVKSNVRRKIASPFFVESLRMSQNVSFGRMTTA